MKNALSALIAVAIYSLCHGQSNESHSIVIVSCKTGELFIDGNSVGKIEADDASRHTLSLGEHYLQVKSEIEKTSLTIKVDPSDKSIVKIGCNATQSSAAQTSLPSSILVNKQLNLGGALTNEIQQNVFALEAGDAIQVNCAVLNKKGVARISIVEYLKRAEIFRNESFNSLQQRITIPSRGIYIVNVTTSALFGKDIKLMVERFPAPGSSPNFKTNVRRVLDTSSTEVMNTITRVYSQTNSNPNRTNVKVNLPQGTTYWVYWIGVSQEAKEKMKSFTATLAGAGKLFSANPLVQFGMNLIPSLPALSATSTITYRFTDSKNAQLFINKQPCGFYNFKYADNVSSDYALMSTVPKEVVLALQNNSMMIGQDVEIRVVAFTVKQRLVMEN